MEDTKRQAEQTSNDPMSKAIYINARYSMYANLETFSDELLGNKELNKPGFFQQEKERLEKEHVAALDERKKREQSLEPAYFAEIKDKLAGKNASIDALNDKVDKKTSKSELLTEWFKYHTAYKGYMAETNAIVNEAHLQQEYVNTVASMKVTQVEDVNSMLVRSAPLDLDREIFPLGGERRNPFTLDQPDRFRLKLPGQDEPPNPFKLNINPPRDRLVVTDAMRENPQADAMRLVQIDIPNTNHDQLTRLTKELASLKIPVMGATIKEGRGSIAIPKAALASMVMPDEKYEYGEHVQKRLGESLFLLSLPSGKKIGLEITPEVLQQRAGSQIPLLRNGEWKLTDIVGDGDKPVVNFDRPGSFQLDLWSPEKKLKLDVRNVAENTEQPVLRLPLKLNPERKLKLQLDASQQEPEISLKPLTPEELIALTAGGKPLKIIGRDEPVVPAEKEIPLTFDVRGINNRVQLRLNDGLKEPSEQPRTETDKPEIQLLPLLTLPLKTPPKR